ncbi:MAG: 23S rRNA (uracil(1939)-C(5))-methyltransferase RlmD, partial [Lachnospiraceae bacterium]|nr:23S rRNA (uracil(1939)-C(5))-methyltransferase RlmD [Lachnospiraceae bacterium]
MPERPPQKFSCTVALNCDKNKAFSCKTQTGMLKSGYYKALYHNIRRSIMAKQYRVKCHETDSSCRGKIKFNNSAFSVPGLLDGETAMIELVYGKDRGSTAARLVSLETASPERRAPFCKAFGRCGGCQLQYASYTKQLALKKAAAERLLSEFAPVPDVIGMPEPYHYRHKIHASFYRSRRGMELGIYEENTHKVISVSDCRIQNRTANAILRTIRKLADEFRLSAYNEDRGQGLLRHVLIRCGYASRQIMVVLVLGTTVFPGKNHFIEKLRAAHPEITTIVQNINNQKTSMVLGSQETVLYGPGYIEDSLCGLNFRISPKAFYQVNPEQTEFLYQTALRFAGLTGRETVLDAYCGTGTIGLIAAGSAAQVIGVESNASAIRDAMANAAANQVKNIHFVHADAGKYIAEAAAAENRPDVVFLDPPRSGADETFLKGLAPLAPERIVYVSCDLETLARDLRYLVKTGYEVKEVQAVDLFPWTEKVETVVMLSHKKPDSVINVKVEFGEGEGKVPLDNIAKRAAAYKPKECVTYKMIKEYIEAKYGFKVHTTYIAEVKRDLGLPMYDASNAVE